MTKQLPKPIADLLANEELLFPLLVSWLLAPPLLALAGFYAGTIFGSPHTVDLQTKDMVRGGLGALIGLGLGVVLAIVVTLVFPKYAKAEADHH